MVNTLIKKRLLSGVIDLLSYSLIFIFSVLGIRKFFIISDNTMSFLLFLFMVEFFIYFALVIKWTSGYTFGYYIAGIKITPVKNINIFILVKRAILSSIFYFTTYGLRKIKYNTFGQFWYDEKYGLRVIGKNDKNNILEKKEYYVYDFILEYIFLFFKYFLILAIMTFVWELGKVFFMSLY